MNRRGTGRLWFYNAVLNSIVSDRLSRLLNDGTGEGHHNDWPWVVGIDLKVLP
jgi:hypothetical protein